MSGDPKHVALACVHLLFSQIYASQVAMQSFCVSIEGLCKLNTNK